MVRGGASRPPPARRRLGRPHVGGFWRRQWSRARGGLEEEAGGERNQVHDDQSLVLQLLYSDTCRIRGCGKGNEKAGAQGKYEMDTHMRPYLPLTRTAARGSPRSWPPGSRPSYGCPRCAPPPVAGAGGGGPKGRASWGATDARAAGTGPPCRALATLLPPRLRALPPPPETPRTNRTLGAARALATPAKGKRG